MNGNKKIFVYAAQSFNQFAFWVILGSLIIVGNLSYYRSLTGAAAHDRFLVLLIILSIITPIAMLLLGSAGVIKYGMYREIITDDQGIIFNGRFKKIQIKWNEIDSLEIDTTKSTRLLRTTTRKNQIVKISSQKGAYYFPLSIKEKAQEYSSWHRLKLIDKDFNRIKEISPSECPLFVEIQEHIRRG